MPQGEWLDYFDAAANKLEIARYFHEQLRLAVAPESSDETAMRANFEGVLYSYKAAEDQLAEGLNHALGLDLDQPNLSVALAATPRSGWRKRLHKVND